ncbi:hypothetical protein P4C99_01650 [Pontiellaceae bacterium B1224]|nr:hypothetical protein [Pontiellaceae bacterium B1224]
MSRHNNVGQASSLSTVARETGWKPVLLSCLFVAILGCSDKQDQSKSLTEPVYSKQYRQDSTTVIVTLSETNIPTSGKIQLMIDVHAPAGMEVILPDSGNFLEPFSVADGYTEPVQTLPNGKQLHRRVWILIPSLPGDHRFQPLEIMAGPDSLKTDALKIHVESLLPPGIDSFEIKDIAEPVALLPEEEQQLQLIKILSGGVCALIFLVLVIRLSRRRPKPEKVLSPHETAWLTLENLPEDELEKIQILHSLLLHFIEAVLNIPTTGKTLDEILPKLPKATLLGQRYSLEKYLNTSEQTRFSNKVPPGFSEELEQYVRKFIQQNPEVKCA